MEQVIPTVLHALKFRLISACRTSPIELHNILRGVIDAESLGTLRVAGTAADFLTHLSAEPSSTPQAWDLTDKRRVLWLLPTKSLRDVLSSVGKSQGRGGAKGSSKGGRQVLDIADNARASQLWQAGSSHFCDVCPTIQYSKVANVICAARPPRVCRSSSLPYS